MRRACTVDGCDRAAFGRGLCGMHYQRARAKGDLPDFPAPRVCAQCGVTFTTRKWNAIYCSKRCNEAAQYDRVPRRTRTATTCAHCGKELADPLRVHAKFCSAKCGNNYRNALRAASTLAAKAGRVCRGCGGTIPVERKVTALYCSDACKVKSRRHETYGVTKAELDALLAQHEVCAICQSPKWGRKGPQVDHDHNSGRVRGILCTTCNTNLGRWRHNIAVLEAAIRYLKG